MQNITLSVVHYKLIWSKMKLLMTSIYSNYWTEQKELLVWDGVALEGISWFPYCMMSALMTLCMLRPVSRKMANHNSSFSLTLNIKTMQLETKQEKLMVASGICSHKLKVLSMTIWLDWFQVQYCQTKIWT